jgi:hypothetical protein
MLRRAARCRYRLDHSPLVIRQQPGSEGFLLHGGPITPDGRMNPSLQVRPATRSSVVLGLPYVRSEVDSSAWIVRLCFAGDSESSVYACLQMCALLLRAMLDCRANLMHLHVTAPC